MLGEKMSEILRKRQHLDEEEEEEQESYAILIPFIGEETPGTPIRVPKKIAKHSKLMNDMIVDDDPNEESEIPLPNVTPSVLKKVVEFLEMIDKDPVPIITKPIQTNVLEQIVGGKYATYMEVSAEEMLQLISASGYLDIEPLKELATCKMACLVKDRDLEEVKKTFGITKDLSPEEEQAVRYANPWIFELPVSRT
jgi:hypothetical protein